MEGIARGRSESATGSSVRLDRILVKVHTERVLIMKNKWLVIAGMIAMLFLGVGFSSPEASAKKRTFTVNPKTIPCSITYRQKPYYNKKTKQYYMLQSYLDRLSKTGGTLRLKKGTYKIPGTLYVPSNVTIDCKNGVKLKKTTAAGTKKLKATKYMFQMVSESKAKGKQSVGKYTASKSAAIQGTGTVTVDMGKISGATAVYAGHASGIRIKGIKFRNKKGGSYIWIEGSQNVTISSCIFQQGTSQSGLKNRMAVRLETANGTTSDFSGKWSKSDNTKNKNITIQNNTFTKPDIGVGTTKSVVVKSGSKTTEYAQREIKITGNTFTNTKKAAVYAVLWKKPSLQNNIIKITGKNSRTSAALYGYGVTDPGITGNKISGCRYAAVFDTAKNTGKGKKFPAVSSVLGTASVNKLTSSNTVADLSHYYVTNGKIRILYFRNKSDRNFTISTTTAPYREKYNDASDFSSRKVYYTFLSYMEQLEYAGGGTVTVKAGTYSVTNNICIPSNVTMNLEDGVTFVKAGTTATDICYAKSIFTLVPPSKDGTVKTIRAYNGSHDIKIIGTGTARINCANVKNCMGLVMGHARNITIQGVTFQNQYGSHFVELNSSNNVTFQDCTFEGFQVLDGKSHKECINIDGTDLNTDGFNYDWSAHDKTVCQNIYIKNNTFKNIGTAVGSHTYSANGSTQLYHQNVQILNNTIDGTYNAGIRALNWKDTVIKGNTFMGIQNLSDGNLNANGNQTRYVAMLLRGVVNPTVTENIFEDCEYYPIRVVMQVSASVEGAIKAGYADTVSSLSDANWAAMQNNKLVNIKSKYQNIVVRANEDQTDSDAEKKPFLE